MFFWNSMFFTKEVFTFALKSSYADFFFAEITLRRIYFFNDLLFFFYTFVWNRFIYRYVFLFLFVLWGGMEQGLGWFQSDVSSFAAKNIALITQLLRTDNGQAN